MLSKVSPIGGTFLSGSESRLNKGVSYGLSFARRELTPIDANISSALEYTEPPIVTQSHDSGALVSAEGSWLVTRGGGFHMSYTVNFENAMADYDFSREPEALKRTPIPWQF